MEPRQFTVFGKLPAELRDRIWEAAFCSFTEPAMLWMIEATAIGPPPQHTRTEMLERSYHSPEMPATSISLACAEAWRVYNRLRRLRYDRITFWHFGTPTTALIGPSTGVCFPEARDAFAVAEALDPGDCSKIRSLAFITDRTWMSCEPIFDMYMGLHDLYVMHPERGLDWKKPASNHYCCSILEGEPVDVCSSMRAVVGCISSEQDHIAHYIRVPSSGAA